MMKVSLQTRFQRSRAPGRLVSGVLIGLLAILVIAPLMTLVYASLVSALPFTGEINAQWTLANYSDVWTRELSAAIVNTLIITTGGGAIAMLFGGGLAWLVTRTDLPGKWFANLVAVMPLFVSLLVASVAWSLLASGDSGYLNLLLAAANISLRVDIQSLAGVAFLYGIYYAPYPYLFISGALMLVNSELEEAAAVHGATMSRILRRVTFPLVRPAIIGSTMLILVLMIEDFPVPQLLIAPVGVETLSIRIYHLVSRSPAHPNQAAALSVFLCLFVVIFTYVQRTVLLGRDYRTVTGKGMNIRPVRLGLLRFAALGLIALYAICAVALPLFALFEAAFRRNLFVADFGSLFDPAQFSFVNMSRSLASSAVHDGLLNSLIAAGITASLGTTFFFLLAYVVARTRLPGRGLMEYLAMVPLALPALVMGLGILWTWVAVPLPVYGTMAILIIAFVTRFLPQGFKAVSASISQVHEDLEQAAMVAGATPFKALRRIVFPLVRPGIVSAAFLVFILSLRELTASLFLYTTNTRMLSIVIFEAYENGSWGAVASISLIYTSILIVLTLLGRRWMGVSLSQSGIGTGSTSGVTQR